MNWKIKFVLCRSSVWASKRCNSVAPLVELRNFHMNQQIKTYFIGIRCSPSETGAQLGKKFLQSLIFSLFEIFEPPLFGTLVANTHAHVSQTRTAHAQIGKMDFPCGFSQHRGKTSAHAPNYEIWRGIWISISKTKTCLLIGQKLVKQTRKYSKWVD